MAKHFTGEGKSSLGKMKIPSSGKNYSGGKF
jgi:hypothetical protein